MFDLIKENNLYTDVQDQVLLLVEFDHELMEKRKLEGLPQSEGPGEAILLLVDKFHSIPVSMIVPLVCFHLYNICSFRLPEWSHSCKAGRTFCFCIWTQ